MQHQLIESCMHGKVLSVRCLSKPPCSPIQLWAREYCSPSPSAQLFCLQLMDKDRFWIRSALCPNMVLDVEGARTNGGTRVILYPCNSPPSPNQLWRWKDDRIESCLGDLVLDVEGEEKDDGARLIVWPRKDGGNVDNQRWRLVFP